MDRKTLCRGCFGEFLGTFMLVLFGTGSVAVTVLFKAHVGLLQVAGVWGIGVTLAIYATRHLSCAHLNPAVSLGMVLANRMKPGMLPWYIAFQLLGAVAAGGMVLLLFGDSIAVYESAHQIARGAPASVGTAMMFGEYFPNPGAMDVCPVVTMTTAALAEGFGTFLLVLLVFVLTDGCNVGRPADGSTPVFIGAAVAAIISILAPLTQAGLNPARDFGPPLVAYLAGWNSVAIPGPRGGFFTVYILAPLLGGAVAAVCFRFLVSRLMGGPTKTVCGQEGSCDDSSADCCAATEQQGDS